MTILYSYCIPYDDGAAPNPFWGVCTLAICKPRIRLAATVGDWIVGTGSMNSPIGDIAGMVVYAMRVTQKMTMEEYDQFTRLKLPRKIPLMKSADPRRRYGDSIYDFAPPIPRLRPGVHGEGNRSTDLRGGFVLLSNHFFYFGDKPVALPYPLSKIVKQGQGHRSLSNAPFVDDSFTGSITSVIRPILSSETPRCGHRWTSRIHMSPARLVGSRRPKLIWQNPTIRSAIAADNLAVREADGSWPDLVNPLTCFFLP